MHNTSELSDLAATPSAPESRFLQQHLFTASSIARPLNISHVNTQQLASAFLLPVSPVWRVKSWNGSSFDSGTHAQGCACSWLESPILIQTTQLQENQLVYSNWTFRGASIQEPFLAQGSNFRMSGCVISPILCAAASLQAAPFCLQNASLLLGNATHNTSELFNITQSSNSGVGAGNGDAARRVMGYLPREVLRRMQTRVVLSPGTNTTMVEPILPIELPLLQDSMYSIVFQCGPAPHQSIPVTPHDSAWRLAMLSVVLTSQSGDSNSQLEHFKAVDIVETISQYPLTADLPAADWPAVLLAANAQSGPHRRNMQCVMQLSPMQSTFLSISGRNLSTQGDVLTHLGVVGITLQGGGWNMSLDLGASGISASNVDVVDLVNCTIHGLVLSATQLEHQHDGGSSSVSAGVRVQGAMSVFMDNCLFANNGVRCSGDLQGSFAYEGTAACVHISKGRLWRGELDEWVSVTRDALDWLWYRPIVNVTVVPSPATQHAEYPLWEPWVWLRESAVVGTIVSQTAPAVHVQWRAVGGHLGEIDDPSGGNRSTSLVAITGTSFVGATQRYLHVAWFDL